MKIRELRVGNESAWITPAKTYWNDQIDAKCLSEGWTNAAAMKAAAHSYIDDLQTKYTAYKTGADVDSLKRALLVIYGYVSMKHGINVNDSPDIPNIITDDDIRNFYVNWTSDLPSKESIFTLEPDPPPPPDPLPDPYEPPPVTEGKVVKTDSYTSCETVLTTGNATDSAALIGTETSLAEKVRPFMVYTLYAQPTTSSTGINVKTFVLTTMHVQEILDEFNFSIPGLN